MAFVEGGQESSLNGTTNVTVVSAPGSSTRRLVTNVHFDNVDTVPQTIELYKDKGGTAKRLFRLTLGVGDFYTFDKMVVLDATDESLYAKMTAAATTTNPTVDAAYGDAS